MPEFDAPSPVPIPARRFTRSQTWVFVVVATIVVLALIGVVEHRYAPKPCYGYTRDTSGQVIQRQVACP